MAQHVMLAVAFVLSVVSVAVSYPDAPLYPNNVLFASAPLLRQPVQAAPQYFSQLNSGAYALQNPISSNPTIFVSAQPQPSETNPIQTQRVVTSPAAPPSQGTVFQIVSGEATAAQPAPRNFVTFTRTPTQQVIQQPAEPVQTLPRNFVTFLRSPSQQFAPAVQQDFGSRSVRVNAPAQANEQPVTQFAVRAPVQQFGLRNTLVPAPSRDATPVNALPSQQPGIRTVFVLSPQQVQQRELQADQNARAVFPTKPHTVLVARPAQTAEQPQLLSNNQNQPSSSQFFTRNFGDSGAVTYFIHPLSAPAKQKASSNQLSPDAET